MSPEARAAVVAILRARLDELMVLLQQMLAAQQSPR